MTLAIATLTRPAKRASALLLPRRRPSTRSASTPPTADRLSDETGTPDIWLAGLRLGG